MNRVAAYGWRGAFDGRLSAVAGALVESEV